MLLFFLSFLKGKGLIYLFFGWICKSQSNDLYKRPVEIV